MPVFLQSGYEDSVRSKLGVKTGELPNEVINNRLILNLAESRILKRVPDYAAITDDSEKLMLEGAIVSYICHLLAPSMPRRLNVSVQTIDVRWTKDKVDWNELALLYLAEVDAQLQEITSVAVDVQADSSLGDIIRPNGTRIV